MSYLLTAEMLENSEDDWLATVSSRARARVEVNISELPSDERAQSFEQLKARRCICGSAIM